MSLEIGSFLKEARVKNDLSLDKLQEKTRIQKSFLIAIENGDFDKLPSPFYVRAYLRSYANCVKVEPHHILRKYRKEEQALRGLTGPNKKTSTHIKRTGNISGHTSRMRIDRKNKTSLSTALTVAKSLNKVDELTDRRKRLQRDEKRRNYGYQRSYLYSDTSRRTSIKFPSELGLTRSKRTIVDLASLSRRALRRNRKYYIKDSWNKNDVYILVTGLVIGISIIWVIIK